MSSTIIVSGGTLDEGIVEQMLRTYQGANVIGVDKGLEYLYHHQIMPMYIVGDFDSLDPKIIAYYKKETQVPIREYNPIKDATDTEIAIRLALTLGSKEIVILGATGGRLDHLWANVQSLSIATKAGAEAFIIDRLNRIRVICAPCELQKKDAFGKYLSIFTLDGEVLGFNLKGTKYPLQDHVLKPCDSLTVSNEYQDEKVKIDFLRGTLVVMETRDSEREMPDRATQ